MRRLPATSGSWSWWNQTTWPWPSTIIGPPGPTGVRVTVWVEPGCTIGEGSGVRKIPLLKPEACLSTVMRGGVRPGSEAKCSSLSGWIWVGLSSGGSVPRRATTNEKRSGDRPRTRTTTVTRSPSVSGASGTKMPPRLRENGAMRPRWSPLLAPTTRTDAMRPPARRAR